MTSPIMLLLDSNDVIVFLDLAGLTMLEKLSCIVFSKPDNVCVCVCVCIHTYSIYLQTFLDCDIMVCYNKK